MKVAILAKEEQPFSICRVTPDWILIPSEEGWPKLPLPSPTARVFLRRRVYTGRLRFVSADTDAREFLVRIDPENARSPCTVSPITGA